MYFQYSFSLRLVLFLLISFIGFNSYPQNHELVWQALLDNERIKATELAEKLETKNNVESLLLKRLVDIENGRLNPDFEFLEHLETFDDHAYYLFAGWDTPLFFDDYINNSFSKKSLEVFNYFKPENIENTTVKSGLNYLMAVKDRFRRDWKSYENHLSKINSIRNWEYCGVFENLNSSGLQMPYPPEEEVSKDVRFDAQSNGHVSWYKSKDTEEAYNFFSNQAEYGTGVHYAQTFINSAVDQRILLRVGKGGLFKLWLNDVVITEKDEAYITELDAYTYAVNLKKGVNRILVKLAINSGVPYFIVRLEDLNHQPLNNIKISFDDRVYNQSDEEAINPEAVTHSVEKFFKEKLLEEKADKFLNTYLLYNTYLRNGKVDEATEMMRNWIKDYPESSFVQINLMNCYGKKGDETAQKTLKNKFRTKDPNHYAAKLLEFEEMNRLLKEDLNTFENKMNAIKQATDYEFLGKTTDLFVLMRKQDRTLMRKTLEELIVTDDFSAKLKPTFINFFSRVFNDDEATVQYFEDFNRNKFYFPLINSLSYYYKKQNKSDEALALYQTLHERFPNDNNILSSIIDILHERDEFEKSLPYIDKGLDNYPDSYAFTKLKGDALVQTGNKAEGIKYYKDALKRYSSNYSLRTKINDLENKNNPLKAFHNDEMYDYIEKNRNQIKDNNYGVNGLLLQTDILDYKTGGAEYKVTEIYELTSQNGIDIFKEYSLDLSGDYVIKKSEAIKPNGDILPADRSGTRLVFDNLEIGDVIYIDYESRFSRYGRFYKDYIYNNDFGGYHPFIKEVYRLLTLDKDVNFKVTNGEVDYNKFKKDDYYVHEWSLENNKSISVSEDYMPSFEDIVPRLHISSINSWNEVANWYSDLVRKQLKEDKTIEVTFNTIFPDGYKKYSEDERARRIYDYVTGDFNYSYVNFRQSGYVPQKPSKTIKTKLGDCKDFSSLFLVLAKKAELDVNMVLILTSDYGKNVLVLPSTDFNHAIVRVMLNGEPQFLELTDKHLPYKSLPISLREAKALIIPYNSNSSDAELITIKNANRKKAVMKSESIINVSVDDSKIQLTTSASAHLASYYLDVFESYQDKSLEDEILNEINNRTTVQVKLDEIISHNYNDDKGEFKYKTSLKSDIKINKIGDLLTIGIPYFLNPYNYSVIQSENRSFPIDYKQYENADAYQEDILIKLEDNYQFKDIPSDKTFNFKEHTYQVSFKIMAPNELKVEVYSKMNLEDIKTEDYNEFKKYVEKVLDTREVLVSFKPV
jgi:lipopolysaccharide biosynthesis regulator YciM